MVSDEMTTSNEMLSLKGGLIPLVKSVLKLVFSDPVT